MGAALRNGKQTLFAFSGDHATSYAAAIAYYTLFSIFPFTLFVIGVAGYFVSDSQRTRLASKIASALGTGISGNITQQVQNATHGNGLLGIIALVTALWSASAVFGAIRNGLQVIWNARPGRNYAVWKLIDLAGVVGLTLVLATSLVATVALTLVSKLVNHVIGAQAGGAVSLVFAVALFLVPVLVAFLAFSLLYTLASNPGIGWHDIWPAALFGAVGFEVLNFALSFYFRYFGNYAKVYGAIGGVIAFLFYAYLIGCLILLGGEIADHMIRKGVPRGQWRPSSAGAGDPNPAREAAPAAASEQASVYTLAANGTSDHNDESITAGELFPEQDQPPRESPRTTPRQR